VLVLSDPGVSCALRFPRVGVSGAPLPGVGFGSPELAEGTPVPVAPVSDDVCGSAELVAGTLVLAAPVAAGMPSAALPALTLLGQLRDWCPGSWHTQQVAVWPSCQRRNLVFEYGIGTVLGTSRFRTPVTYRLPPARPQG